MIRAALILLFCAGPLAAETVVAAHTLRPRQVIEADDIMLTDDDIAGGISDPALVIGQEARVALYQGRPIRSSHIGPPALVERNQIVSLKYISEGLTIATEGRALGRAAVGEALQIMNLSSRTTVLATITADGTARVGP